MELKYFGEDKVDYKVECPNCGKIFKITKNSVVDFNIKETGIQCECGITYNSIAHPKKPIATSQNMDAITSTQPVVPASWNNAAKKHLSKETYIAIIGVCVLVVTIFRMFFLNHSSEVQKTTPPLQPSQVTQEQTPPSTSSTISGPNKQTNPSQPVSSNGSSTSGTQSQNDSNLNQPTVPPPKISISGSITPTVAQKGTKVVIKIDVENKDPQRSIDGVRILFSNKDFLEKGLIIVNVMSGGTQDGRAFVWQNEGMKIPPNEKRSFQIVAQANVPGTYQSVINVLTPSSSYYTYEGDNSELVAKLSVLN